MKVQPKYKKGQKVTMQFHMIGLTSEEVGAVEKVHKDGSITLDNDFRFNTKTGECLNDNTFGGASRTLKIDKPEPIVPHRWRGEDETCGEE
jgi:hypothetical protein